MATSTVSKNSCGEARLAALLLGSAAALGACGGGGVTPSSPPSGSSSGGGGTTVTQSPYLLYASNYVVFPAEVNGSFLGSIQGGNLYAGSSTPDVIYGNYSAPAATISATQFYNVQYQWTVPGGNALDYAYVSVLPPASGQTFSSLTPFDISQSGNLLIQMGNTYTQSDNPTGTGGNATVFTVVLDNDTSAAQNGSGATAVCSYNQTLVTVGRNNSATNTPTPLGVYSYEIPLTMFTNCSKGSIATLQSTGVTSVAVRISGDLNPNIIANEFDTIAVGYIGFTM
jgi:hypothetical protein